MDPIIIDKTEILKRYKPIDSATHKGIQGHALLIGGSYGKIGSVCLSSKAALKTGCGLVTAFIPKCGYEIVQISIPEVMVLTDIQEKFISNITFDFIPKVYSAIGPKAHLDCAHDAPKEPTKNNIKKQSCLCML